MEKAEINEEQHNRLKDTAVKLAPSPGILKHRENFSPNSLRLLRQPIEKAVFANTLTD